MFLALLTTICPLFPVFLFRLLRIPALRFPALRFGLSFSGCSVFRLSVSGCSVFRLSVSGSPLSGFPFFVLTLLSVLYGQ